MKPESELYRTKELEALFNYSPDAIASLDANYCVTDINSSFVMLFGYSLPEIKGLHIDDVMNMNKAGSANTRQTYDIISGKHINEEGIRYNRDGQPIDVLIKGYPIMIGGKMAGAYAIYSNITERKQTEHRIFESEKKLQEAQRLAKMGRWEFDLINNHLEWSPTIYEIFEIDPTNFTATYEAFIDLVHPEDREIVNNAYRQSVADKKPYTVEHRLKMRDGRIKWVSEQCYTEYNREGLALRSVGIVQDITERKKVEIAMDKKNTMLTSLNKYANEQGETRSYDNLINLIAKQLTDYSGAIFVAFNEYNPLKKKLILKNIRSDKKIVDTAIRIGGKGITKIVTPVSQDMYREITCDIVGFRHTLNEITQGIVPVTISSAISRATGINYYIYLSHIVEDQLYGTSIVGLAEEEEAPSFEFLESYAHISAISLRRLQAEEKIRHMGFHDTLTGLYNRNYLDEEMKRLDTSRQLPLSLIIADLNGLKLINDTYGHQVGDQALQVAAKILRKSCRTEDVIARWGGDEFVLLLPKTTQEQAWRLCKRINGYSNKEFLKGIPISLALGVAEKVDPDISLSEILREAENDMYRQKLTESRSAKNALLKSLLKALEAKSYETEAHTRGMQKIAQKIGTAIKLTDAEMKRLELLITLHDIGKINIAEDLLTKPGTLTKEEWDEVKKHPEIGYRIARSTEEFAHVAEDIMAHHERWDGSGYPQELKGENIPLLARITAIADAYEVMSNGRPYKNAMSPEEIAAEFKRTAGTQFDPALVKIILSIIEN